MNLASKSILLDIVISAIITLAGGGSIYSFLFLWVILFIPAISIFISLDIIKGKPTTADETKSSE